MDKGILLTTYRFREDDCAQEAWYLLSNLGYRDCDMVRLKMPGLILLKTNFEPIKAVEDLIAYAEENVWGIRYILKAIPLEAIIGIDHENIIAVATKLASKIEEGCKYRISIKRRNSKISSKELIDKIAANVNRKVDLENFDYIILIEIINEYAGISVIKKEQIFSLHQVRQDSIKKLIL